MARRKLDSVRLVDTKFLNRKNPLARSEISLLFEIGSGEAICNNGQYERGSRPKTVALFRFLISLILEIYKTVRICEKGHPLPQESLY